MKWLTEPYIFNYNFAKIQVCPFGIAEELNWPSMVHNSYLVVWNQQEDN